MNSQRVFNSINYNDQFLHECEQTSRYSGVYRQDNVSALMQQNVIH